MGLVKGLSRVHWVGEGGCHPPSLPTTLPGEARRRSRCRPPADDRPFKWLAAGRQRFDFAQMARDQLNTVPSRIGSRFRPAACAGLALSTAGSSGLSPRAPAFRSPSLPRMRVLPLALAPSRPLLMVCAPATPFTPAVWAWRAASSSPDSCGPRPQLFQWSCRGRRRNGR